MFWIPIEGIIEPGTLALVGSTGAGVTRFDQSPDDDLPYRLGELAYEEQIILLEVGKWSEDDLVNVRMLSRFGIGEMPWRWVKGARGGELIRFDPHADDDDDENA